MIKSRNQEVSLHIQHAWLYRSRTKKRIIIAMLLTLTLLGLLALVIFSLLPGANASPPMPHIVFVLADDLGWHDVSYHDSRIQTPTIDSLAASGVILNNYYVQPSCSASRSQLLSGRYQIHTGLQHYVFTNESPQGLPLDSPTLADKLREAGYATHQVGKWHLGFFKEEYMPNKRGFDTTFGTIGSGAYYYDHTMICDFDGNNYLDLRLTGTPVYNMTGVHATFMHTEHAIDLIAKHDGDKPLFLYMAYQTPHSPLDPPQAYQDPYNDITDPERRGFAGLVSMLDEGVANLTDVLKSSGLWDDTIFIFSTDNGGHVEPGHGGNNYPLRGWKHSLWEGGIRAVGFVTGGANIEMARGVVNNELIHITDWFPTLVGVAGGNLDGTLPLDGLDQWETITTGATTNRTWILHNIDPLEELLGERLFEGTFDTRVMAALRVGDLKIITGNPGNGSWYPPPEEEDMAIEYPAEEVAAEKNLWLFNITADPEERTDLSETRPDLVKEMLDFLLEINTTSAPAYYPDPDPQCDPSLYGNVWSPWQ